MRPSTEKALGRVLRAMERSSRPRRSRFSTSPLVLAVGLILGYQLLVRLLPRTWSVLLPGGLDQARSFRGWPGLVFQLALVCYYQFPLVVGLGSAIVFLAILVSGWIRPLRFVVWLAAFTVILIDAGIVFVILQTAQAAVMNGMP